MIPRFLLLCAGLTGLLSLASATIQLQSNALGNTYLTSESPVFTCTTSGNEIRWQIANYFGTVIKSGYLIPSAGTATLKPNLGLPGYFELSVTEKLNGTVTSQASTSFAVLAPFTAPANSQFGTQTHFAQFDPVDAMPLLSRVGVAHLRDEHYWSLLESQPGAFSFPANFGNFMAAAAAQNLSPLITLDWTNPLYCANSSLFAAPSNDFERAGFANYATQIASRYGSQVQALEIWNEFNAGTFVDGLAATNKPYYYSLLVQRTARAVHAARPEIKIVAGATVPVSHGFFKSVFENGALPDIDILSVHPYRPSPSGVELDIQGLRDLVKSYNSGAEKPIWASEFSMDIANATQLKEGAAYLAQTATLLLSERVERIYYYLGFSNSEFPHRGLFATETDPRGRLAPNPAAVVYGNLIRQLSGATAHGRLDGTPSFVYVCKFLQGSTPVYVLWSLQPATIKLATTAANLSVTDAVGQKRTLAPTGGTVTLALTGDVQYVRGNLTGIAEISTPALAESRSGFSREPGKFGWSCGYAALAPDASYQPAQFVPMRWELWGNENYRWLGYGGYNFIDVEVMHPSQGWAIRRWTSDRAATVTVAGHASRPGLGGDGANLRLFVDGREIYSHHLAPGESLDFNLPGIALSAGSTVDFTLNQGAENSFDATTFTATITQ